MEDALELLRIRVVVVAEVVVEVVVDVGTRARALEVDRVQLADLVVQANLRAGANPGQKARIIKLPDPAAALARDLDRDRLLETRKSHVKTAPSPDRDLKITSVLAVLSLKKMAEETVPNPEMTVHALGLRRTGIVPDRVLEIDPGTLPKSAPEVKADPDQRVIDIRVGQKQTKMVDRFK